MPGNASEGGEAAIPVPSAEFIERVNSLGGHLYFENDSAKLGLDLADSDLQTNYGFNDSDVRQLRKIIEETARADESVLFKRPFLLMILETVSISQTLILCRGPSRF